MPGSQHGPSILNSRVYEALRRRGYSKQRAARISNAQLHKRHKQSAVAPLVIPPTGPNALFNQPGVSRSRRRDARLKQRALCPQCRLKADAPVVEVPTGGSRQIAPGITRIRGNLCNVHGRYGRCPGSGASTPRKGKKPKQPAKTPEQRQAERDALHAKNTQETLSKLNIAPDGQQALEALRRGEQPDADAVARGGFEQAGLVERADDGSYRMTGSGRELLHASSAGDVGRAGDTISSARDRMAKRKPAKPPKEAKPAKGGGGGKGKPDKEQQRADNRKKVRDGMAAEDTGIAPAGFDALTALGDGQEPDDTGATGLISMGLAERGSDGHLRLTSGGRVALHAADSGDVKRTADAISAAHDRATAASERATARQQRAAETRRRRAENEAKRQRRTTTKQDDQDKAMFAAMGSSGSGGGGGGKSGGGGSKLWPKGPSGKRTPQAAAAENRSSSGDKAKPKKDSIDNLPQSLRDMTPGQHKATVSYLSELPLSELRRRQDLVRQQKKIAHDEYQRSGFSERNNRGMENLDIMEQHLRAAIDKQVFGSGKKKPKTKAMVTKADRFGGKKRSDLNESDFAGPNRTYPIMTAQDVKDAAHLIGKAANPAAVKARIIAIAKRKGFADAIPEAWREKSFTVYKQKNGTYRWVAMSSNAYQDRDGEIVSEKALCDDCARADQDGNYGPLRWWHQPSIDIGVCDFNHMHGRMLIESGTFKDAAIGQAVATNADKLQLSIGFTHAADEPDASGVFHHIKRFERSLVPKGRAANPFTSIVVKEPDMASLKEAWGTFVNLFDGDEEKAKAYATAAEQTQKELDERKARYKEAPEWAQVLIGRIDSIEATLKAGPPMVEGSPEEEAAEPPEEAMAEGDTVDDGSSDNMLTPTEISAIADAVVQRITPLLDLEKKMAGHMADLKTAFGQVSAAKDATIAEQDTRIKAVEASVKELVGDLPTSILNSAAAMYRPSQSAQNILPAEAVARVKSETNGIPAGLNGAEADAYKLIFGE